MSILNSLAEVGARLRSERVRLGLNQADFGAKGGVGRTTQINYESGERPCDVNYLAALAAEEVDVAFVITGRRGGGRLCEDQHELLTCYAVLEADERRALLQVARSMSGRT